MIDISLPLDWNLITYPGDARYEHYDYMTHEKNGVHITRVIMETHSGTHIDAPFHALPNGGTMSSIPLEHLNGPATVVEVEGNAINAEDIPGTVEKRVLFKTKNSGLYDSFHEDFCYISESAGKRLVELGVETVGIDYLSIEQFGTKGMKVHKILLERGIAIIEGLMLKGVKPGRYDLMCLPIRIDTDGAPCRAVLK
jgi:arylformamidase